jgi:hypothetical protein
MHHEDRLPDEPTIDEAAALLHRAGWSAGDLAIKAAAGVIWTVFAHREEQRIVIRAQTQQAAWQCAADAAGRLPD